MAEQLQEFIRFIWGI